MIDKKEFNLRQNKTLSEVKTYSNTILGLKEKIEGFLNQTGGFIFVIFKLTILIIFHKLVISQGSSDVPLDFLIPDFVIFRLT